MKEEKYYSYNELIRNKEYDLALNLLNQNYKKYNDNKYLVKIAEVYKLQNKNNYALKYLLKCYKKSPDSTLAGQIAESYFQLGKFKKAVKYYQDVIDFEGISSNNIYNLACSYHYDGNYTEAYKGYINA